MFLDLQSIFLLTKQAELLTYYYPFYINCQSLYITNFVKNVCIKLNYRQTLLLNEQLHWIVALCHLYFLPEASALNPSVCYHSQPSLEIMKGNTS